MRYRDRVLVASVLGVSVFSFIHLPYVEERSSPYIFTVSGTRKGPNQIPKRNLKHRSHFSSSRKSIPAKTASDNKGPGSDSIKIILASTPRPWLLSTQLPSLDESGNYNCSDLPPPKPISPSRLPVTSLSSMPGSGNTWMRILLSSLTGITTGDMYVDTNFRSVPGFSTLQDDTVIVIKSHEPYFKTDFEELEYSHFKRCVVLVRHPMDVAIASFNFAAAHSHTKTPPITKYLEDGVISSGWRKAVTGSLSKWLAFMTYFLKHTKKEIYVVFYENLKTQLREEMVKINEYLGIPLRKRRLECLLSDEQSLAKQEKFLRRKRIYPHQVVDAEMAEEIQEVVNRFKDMFRERFNSSTDASNLPEYYSKQSLMHAISSYNNTQFSSS